MGISQRHRERFRKKLVEQLGFLDRSSKLFDTGFEEEAIRIAQTLRVIFHQTNTSTSLITHLGFGGKRMLSSSLGGENWMNYLNQRIDLRSSQPVAMIPKLGSQFIPVSIRGWWEESVFQYSAQSYPRRRIILSAANKDGGAHIAETLEKYYESLCEGGDMIGIVGNLQFDGEAPFKQGLAIHPKNAHLALIRQFAHEVRCAVSHFKWLE